MDEENPQAPKSESQPEIQTEEILSQLGNTIAEGLIRGLEESGLLNRFLEVLENLAQRVEKLEQSPNQPETKPTPNQKPSASPPVSLPEIGALTMDMPQLSLGIPVKRLSRRSTSRLRNNSRPTITYRVDPRNPAEPQTNDKICGEAGCDRLARARGLCSLHYQRVRYKERKLEQKQTSLQAVPPPPPPTRRPSIVSVRRNGGTRGIFALLYDEKGRKLLAGLINQLKIDRSDLVKKLNLLHEGMPGVPVDEEDVVRAVHYHKLTEALMKRERDVICRCLTKLRGSLVKAAQKLKMEPDRLRSRINELELFDEVTNIRNEFKEEVLDRLNFNQRLDLALTKEKYLEDLGIVREVDASLRKELSAQIEKLTADKRSEPTNDSIRGALQLDEERFRRLLRRFDLDSTNGQIQQASISPGGP